MGRMKDKLENLLIVSSKINYGIRNRKQKCWLILTLLLLWGNSNLIARLAEVPSLERGLVLAVGLVVAALILVLKPEY